MFTPGRQMIPCWGFILVSGVGVGVSCSVSDVGFRVQASGFWIWCLALSI